MASGPPSRKPSPAITAVPRRPTESGLSVPPLFPDDEPTKPGTPAKEDRAAVLVRLYTNLTPEERRRLVLLADAWFRCSANGRALIEGLANELALPS